MTYWFTIPQVKGLMPLASSSAMRGLSTTFTVPKIFMGANVIPEGGRGIVRILSAMCPKKRAFIVCGGHASNRLAARVSRAMKNGQFTTQTWDKAEPEAPLPNAKECAQAMTQFEPDLIIAVGGGSVMDITKAAWILYERPDITDLGMLLPVRTLGLRKKAILVAVPTTSGTGSECTSAAVLSDEETKRKVPIASRELFPDFAVIDPTFAMGMPPKLTVGTGMDALTHAMDCVMSPAANDMTDALALRAIEMVFKYLPRAYRNPRDREARFRMHIASSMAGIAFGNAGLGLTHSLGHVLGKVFSIHHGVSVGIIIPYALQFYSPVTDKYLDICKALDIKDGTKEKSLASLVGKLKALFQELDLPLDLKGLGITKKQLEDNIDKLALDALEDPDTFSCPRPITVEQCKQFFRYAYEGKDIDF